MDASQFYTVTYYNEAYYNMSKTLDIVCWTFVIVLAVATWDWITNLPKEYERIWKREFSIVTVFYTGSRYWTLACLSYLVFMYSSDNHTFEYCEKWFRWSCGITMPIELFSGGILLIRTYAFTGRKLYLLIVFVAMYIGMFAYMVYVTITALQLIPWMIVGQTRGRCITAGYTGNHIATGFWIAPLMFSFILTVVTVVHSIKIRQRMPSSKRSPIFRVFIRDGIVYLAVVTMTNVLNVAFFTQKTPELEGSAMAFQFLLSSLMSCQLVLSLRDAEVANVSSAAASIATKSFWLTGNTSAVPVTTVNENNNTFRVKNGSTQSIGDSKEAELTYLDGHDTIPLHSVAGSPKTPNAPIQVHIDRQQVSQVSESEKMQYIPQSRY